MKCPVKFSPRQAQAAKLVGAGLIRKEIAGKLKISIHTTDKHLREIRLKLNCTTTSGAAIVLQRKQFSKILTG